MYELWSSLSVETFHAPLHSVATQGAAGKGVGSTGHRQGRKEGSQRRGARAVRLCLCCPCGSSGQSGMRCHRKLILS